MNIEYKPDATKTTMNQFMALKLNDHDAPYFFENDSTSWEWTDDRRTLKIVVNCDPLNFDSHCEVYKVAASKVIEWTYSD